MEPYEPIQNINSSIPSISPEQFPEYSSYERPGNEGMFLSPEELITQTDEFMQRFKEMAEKEELPETVFFVDKSARPVAYMFQKLFPVYYPGMRIPDIRFINIGGSGSRFYDSDSRPFTGDPEIIRQTYGDHINVEGRLTVVDECSITGKALKHAAEALKKAFPDASVSTMIAYGKVPNWYQNEYFLGVKEYTKYDYENKTLGIINQEFGTNYKDKFEMFNDNQRSTSTSSRFWEVYNELEGKIPHVKRGQHVQTIYEYPKDSVDQTTKGISPNPVEVKINYFLKAREELDRICEEIVKRKVQSNQQ